VQLVAGLEGVGAHGLIRGLTETNIGIAGEVEEVSAGLGVDRANGLEVGDELSRRHILRQQILQLQVHNLGIIPAISAVVVGSADTIPAVAANSAFLQLIRR